MGAKELIAARLAEHAAATLVYVDTDLRVCFANRHCHDLLGHEPEALHGRPLGELVDTGTFRLARSHVVELAQGRSEPREYALRHKDGSKKFLQVSAVPDRDAQGRPVGYFLSSADSGGERAARAELSAAERRLSLALQISEAGFWIWDLSAQSEHYSPAFKTLVGYRDADFPAHFTLLGAVHPEDGEETLDALASAIQDGTRFDREFRLRCADGGWRWVRAAGQALRERGSAVATRFEGVARDISRRKLAELELREAQAAVLTALDRCSALAKDLAKRRRLERLRGELVSTANHALRTPLTAIIAALELLQLEAPPADDDAPESLLAMALENAGRLAVLIEQWVELERVDIGATLLHRAPVDLHAMLAGLVGELSRPGRAAPRLQATAQAARACVNGDPAKLQQALSHLIAQAVERSPAAAAVNVRLDVRDQTVVLCIEDQAPPVAQGTDFGLALAKAIVTRLDGRLRVERGSGAGVLVIVELPWLREAAHA